MPTASRIKQLERWDHRYLWHPFTQMQEWTAESPLLIEQGKGASVFDVHGRKYLDGTSSVWVNIHGHRHPVLDRALAKQIEKIAHSTFLGLSHEPAIELARALIGVAPRGLSRVFYSDDGSTAVEVALKMAVQYWQQKAPCVSGKTKFVRLTLAYHGDTLGAVSVGNIELFHGRFAPLLFPTLSGDAPYCYRCPLKLTYPSCRMACLEPIERLLRTRHEEIAGIILEPIVQAAAGMVTAPPGYLTRIRELCDEFGVLLIADEVATGFGRTGRMFACQHEGVTPDLMAVSKGLTGGYLPLAATLTTDTIYQAFLGRYDEWKTFFHGHSYTANPLGCAVALANVRLFRQAGTLSKLQSKIALLSRLLQPMARQRHVGDIRQRGFMVGVELVQDRVSREPYPLEARIGHQVAREARERGLLLRPLGNVLALVPPLTTTASELTRMVSILLRSIERVTMTGRASRPPRA